MSPSQPRGMVPPLVVLLVAFAASFTVAILLHFGHPNSHSGGVDSSDHSSATDSVNTPADSEPDHDLPNEFYRHGAMHLAAVSLEILVAYFFVHAWLERSTEEKRRRDLEALRTALKEFLDDNLAPLHNTMDGDLKAAFGESSEESEGSTASDTLKSSVKISLESYSMVCATYRNNRTGYRGYKTWMMEVRDVLTRNTTLFERLGPSVLSTIYKISTSIDSLVTVPVIQGEKYERETAEHFLDVREHVSNLLAAVRDQPT